jgi:hypothetical protein
MPLPDTFASQLDDPRWNGAWHDDFIPSSSTEAGVRIVKEGGFLFISLDTPVDPNGAAINSDAVYLGFSRDGVTAEMVKITMTAVPPLTNATQISSVNWWKTTDGGATPWPKQGGPLLWATTSNIHVWSGTGTGNGDSWAFNAKIDLTAVGAHLDGGAALSSNFYIWYEILVQTPAGPVPYNRPLGTTLTFNGMNQALLQAGASWANVYPTMATNCPAGISIDPMHIGVTPISGSGIPSTTVHYGTGHAANDFVALLDNGGSTLPNANVKARFRLANWGSMIGVGGDWHDIIPSPGGGVPGTRDNVGNQITFHCVNPPDVSDAPCYQLPVGAPPDQCLLVELSQTNASGVKFLHDSARRNMDFVNASSFQRSAEISVRGLTPLPGSTGTRDAYIYVRTLNLAENVDGNKPVVIPDPVPYIEPDSGSPNPDQPGVAPRKPPMAAPKDQAAAAPRYRMNTYERVASVYPTYEVHVYHDTGRTRTEDGTTAKVLEPQAPFGYFVSHQGDLAGWKHGIQGEGFVLEEISPNFYHAKIPDNGSIKVKTKITTCEKYVFGLFRCCCEVGRAGGGTPSGALAIFGLASIAVARRRTRVPRKTRRHSSFPCP